jgi:hypothetical protein
MSLLAQQMAIGRCLRASSVDPLSALMTENPYGVALDQNERTELIDLVQSPGFDFTRRVQRSWCVGRTEAAAKLTLSALPDEKRRRVVEDWVAAGGGTVFDPASEADSFLEFVASRLADPSHQLTVCRMEQAFYRASEAALTFTPPETCLLDDSGAMLLVGKAAGLVQFFADPGLLLETIEAKQMLPPLSDRGLPVLFAPGLPNLFRMAKYDEVAIWRKLARPTAIRLLSRDSHTQETIEELFSIGAVDIASKGSQPIPARKGMADDGHGGIVVEHDLIALARDGVA